MPILQVHIPPNRNDSILSVSHSLTSRSLPANATYASARARFYTAPLNLGPESSMALYVVFMEAFAFELTVEVGRPGCNDIYSTFPAIMKILPGLTTKPILASRRPPISVVILGVPPVEELDLIGPLEVFAHANLVLGVRGPAYDVRVVSSQPKPIIAGESGVSLLAHGYYRRLREPVDTLV